MDRRKDRRRKGRRDGSTSVSTMRATTTTTTIATTMRRMTNESRRLASFRSHIASRPSASAAMTLLHHQLSLSASVLHVPHAISSHSLATPESNDDNDEDEDDAAQPSSSSSSIGTVYVHPIWMDRMGWKCDDAIIACHLIDGASSIAASNAVTSTNDDTSSSSSCAAAVRLQCHIVRVCPLDASLHSQSWHTIDLSSIGRSIVSFQSRMSDDDWSTHRRSTTLMAHGAIECAERRRHATDRECAFAPPKPIPAAACVTPTKASKPAMMLPPSARSVAAAEAAISIAPAAVALAMAARLQLIIDNQSSKPRPMMTRVKVGESSSSSSSSSSSPSSSSSDIDYTVHLMTLRTKSTPTLAIRVLFEIVCDESDNRVSSSSSSSPLKSADTILPAESMMLASMVKRMILRRSVCSGAVIDVRRAQSAMLRKWKYLRIREIEPEGEVCQVVRGTQIHIDCTPPSSASTLSHSSAIALSLSSSSPSSALVHPALAALHALLLPPLLHPRAFEYLHVDTPRGLLLSGPPGVGKTYSVAKVCAQLNVELFVMDGAAIFGGAGAGGGAGVAGAAEEMMRNKFKQASQSTKPAVLFIDEIDVLCPHRTNDSSLSSRLVAQMLSLMDGLENRGHLLIVGATNHPNSIDAALRRPGRFDRELALSPPSVAERLDILRYYTKSLPLHDDVNLQKLAEEMIGYVGADIAALVREASMHALSSYQTKTLNTSSSAIPPPFPPSSSSSALPPAVCAADFTAAARLVPASSLRGAGVLASKSTAKFSDIGGLEGVKAQLRQAIEWPLLHSETYARLGMTPPRGILLHGPPGCAKTSLVRAIAASTSASFLPLDTASLYSCFVGDAERILRGVFTRARANRPCVIFLDELDAMVIKRGGEAAGSGSDAHSLESRILATLLNEMDGMLSSAGILVVAATNRIKMIDDALLRPGRFDAIIYVPPPDSASRLDILRVHARSMLADPDSPAVVAELTALADRLELYTGADIANVCRESAMRAIRRDHTGESKVLVSDLVAYVDSGASTPSLTRAMLKQYEPEEKTRGVVE